VLFTRKVLETVIKKPENITSGLFKRKYGNATSFQKSLLKNTICPKSL
jgi:hypothetical protein